MELIETKEHSGVMAAFFLPIGIAEGLYAQVAPILTAMGIVPEKPEDYHVTLCYCGDGGALSSIRDTAVTEIQQWTHYFFQEPMIGEINGIGRFMSTHMDGMHAIYASFDAVKLPGFREDLMERLMLIGLGGERNHGFVPHITLAYIPADMPTPDLRPAPIPVAFNNFTLAWGDTRYEYRYFQPPMFTDDFADMSESYLEFGGIKELFNRFVNFLRGVRAEQEDDLDSSFKVLPDGRWFARWTNNFEDKETEYFPEHAIDEYINAVDNKEWPMPELWYRHMKVPSGVAEWIGREGHIGMAAGRFYDDEVGHRFQKFYRTTKTRHKVSHGFFYPRWAKVEGVYHRFRTFEISPLPQGNEANPYTSFERIKEMAVSEEKRKALEAILGQELASKYLNETAAQSKELEALGLKFKEAVIPPPTPGEDQAAREALKELASVQATVNQESVASVKALQAQVGELTTALNGFKGLGESLTKIAQGINAIQDGEKARNDRQGKLEDFIREQFELEPRATKAEKTIIPENDPYLGHLKDKQLNGDSNAPGGFFGQVLAAAKQAVKEGE